MPLRPTETSLDIRSSAAFREAASLPQSCASSFVSFSKRTLTAEPTLKASPAPPGRAQSDCVRIQDWVESHPVTSLA